MKSKLEETLKQNWTNFLDKNQLMKFVLENARNANFKIVKQRDIPLPQMSITITKFDFQINSFEIWIEFSVPKENGVCVGSHIACLDIESGNIDLISTTGVHFQTEN